MFKYLHVEKPLIDQLRALGWTVIDRGHGHIPHDPAVSLRATLRESANAARTLTSRSRCQGRGFEVGWRL